MEVDSTRHNNLLLGMVVGFEISLRAGVNFHPTGLFAWQSGDSPNPLHLGRTLIDIIKVHLFDKIKLKHILDVTNMKAEYEATDDNNGNPISNSKLGWTS